MISNDIRVLVLNKDIVSQFSNMSNKQGSRSIMHVSGVVSKWPPSAEAKRTLQLQPFVRLPRAMPLFYWGDMHCPPTSNIAARYYSATMV